MPLLIVSSHYSTSSNGLLYKGSKGIPRKNDIVPPSPLISLLLEDHILQKEVISYRRSRTIAPQIHFEWGFPIDSFTFLSRKKLGELDYYSSQASYILHTIELTVLPIVELLNQLFIIISLKLC